MSNLFRDTIHRFRPHPWKGRGDKYLPEIAQELRRILAKTQRGLIKSLWLSDDRLVQLSIYLVEFAEDQHNEIGIWKAVEDYQKELFGTPLPFHCEAGEADSLSIFDERRIRHFCWSMFRQPGLGLLVSPNDLGIQQLAASASEFLATRFARVPKDSGWKRCLTAPLESGGSVKGRLMYLSHIYLLRPEILGVTSGPEETVMDRLEHVLIAYSFGWCGMTGIDLLSRVLSISPEDRQTLRSWSQTEHCAFQVVHAPRAESDRMVLEVKNVLNEREYTVHLAPPPANADQIYKEGVMALGRLVPWRDEWYWGSRSLLYPGWSPDYVERVRSGKAPEFFRAVWVSCPEHVEAWRAKLRELHAEFVARHGSELTVCENGRAAAVEIQRSLSGLSEEEARKRVDESVANQKNIFPEELLRQQKRVALFFNREQGPEWFGDYDLLSRALGQTQIFERGELDLIEKLMVDSLVSPDFVRHLVSQFGDKAIRRTLLVEDESSAPWALEFFLRSFKGEYFEKRIPNSFAIQIALTDNA